MTVCILSVFCLTASWLLTAQIRAYTLKKKILDIPNERSSHSIPTPRGGGVAVVFSLLLTWLIGSFLNENFYLLLVIGLPAAGIAALGWWDDRFNLSAGFRFPLQLLLAGTSSFFLLNKNNIIFWEFLSISLPLWVTIIFSILFIGWMTNLYNFMDGIDGIISLQVISVSLIASMLIYLSSPQGLPFIEHIYLLTAFATLGFLYWNWSPAKIFMGDVGSAFLGFVVSALAIAGHVSGDIQLPVILILHGTFLVDATITLIRRLLSGQRVYQAHRDHAYQHATQKGHSHASVSIVFLLINLTWLAPIAWYTQANPQNWLSMLGLAYTPMILLGFYFEAGKNWSHHKKNA